MAPDKQARNKKPRIDYDAPTTAGISIVDDEEGNEFASAMEEGHRVDPRLQKIFVMAVVLLVLYFLGLVIPTDIFNTALHSGGTNTGYSFSWFVDDLLANVNGIVGVLTGHDDGVVSYGQKMIRYVVIAVTGAGLALTGAMYQGSFKNALISPSTLGVNNGATLGMMVWIVFFVAEDGSNVAWLDGFKGTAGTPDYLWSMYSLSLISFLGCLLIVGIVLAVFFIGSRGSSSPIMMIITGQVIGSVLGAVSNSIRYYYIAENPYSAKSQLLTDLMIASFYRDYTWIDIFAIAIPLIIAFVVVFRLSGRMMMFSFSEGEARTMGVNTKKMQIAIVAVGTLLTAILISFCGQIGFVGFLVPHMARRFVGPNFRYLLPATLLMGGIFVLGAYVLLMSTLGSDYETMVGMFISIGGAAVFLVQALGGKGGARGEFR
ncbi:MAG: iron ABC transporter permease [Coriobacteriia bacterium]|nr:iron ABC transporter permease [Coriobacteriia bacterium]